MRENLVLKIANLLEDLSFLKLNTTGKADAIVAMLESIDKHSVQELVEEYNFQEKFHE